MKKLNQDIIVDEKEKCIRFSGNYVSTVKRIYELIKNVPENERLEKLVSILGFESLNGDENYIKYYTPKPGDIVVDCGAHVGTTVQIFSKLVGDEGIVLAVEPDFRALGMLTHNAGTLNNVKILPYALWNVNGVLPLKYGDPTAGVGMSSIVYQYPYWHPTRAITLDNLLKKFEIDRVDFIKMDVEGSEMQALEGMEETLKNVKAVAIAAYHQIDNNKTESHTLVVPFLEKRGFKTHADVGHDGVIVYGER